MSDTFKSLYDNIAKRKNESTKVEPYAGGNGRIDRAVGLITAINSPFPTGGVLLDVGGAIGNLGYALKDRFYIRYVIDITDECRNPAVAKGNQFICANVDREGLQCPDESIDLIVALDFIEHILDPEKFTTECLRVLKPGGMVLINTPNIQYWRHIQSLVVDGIFPHTSGDKEVYHGGHVAFFNFHDLKQLFNRFNGAEMHIDGLTADPPPPIWMSVANYKNKSIQLSFADLIFSCRKPI
jgi:2-polyprenyl-3-methyl-5-hydroxy-6-metoxy-1,4-benzoquinol methylase